MLTMILSGLIKSILRVGNIIEKVNLMGLSIDFYCL